MNGILDCPACGAEPQWADGLKGHSIHCACGLHTFGFETRIEAVRAWNRFAEWYSEWLDEIKGVETDDLGGWKIERPQ